MTKIITITSGMAGVGKTHLAVNLSLELVRRGRQVGLFHGVDGDSPIDRFIDIQPLAERRHQAEAGQDDQHIISRGYLGIDILSCELPLAEWAGAPVDTAMQCARAMDVEDSYDDFLVDTSGMAPREQACCCLASPVVVLVVTPDPQSQAEAFALLRILQLNGFSGELCIVVNKVSYAMDASDIHQALSHEIGTHLGFNTGMLEVLLEDDSVPRSERYKQAFSAVFPESEAAAGIVAIADDIDTLPDQSSAHALAAYWERFIEFAGAPIRLPGNALLEVPEVAVEECEVEVDDSTGAAGAVGN